MATLVGLALTFNQAKSAANTAREARRVAGEAMGRVREGVVRHELMNCRKLAENTRSAVREQQYVRVVERLDHLRSRFSSLRTHLRFDDDFTKQEFVAMMDDLDIVARAAEVLLRGGSTRGQKNAARTVTDSTKHLDRVVRVVGFLEGKLQQKAFELEIP